MGNFFPTELSRDTEALAALLNPYYVQVTRAELSELVRLIKAAVPELPLVEALNIHIWDKIGNLIKLRAQGGDSQANNAYPAWQAIMTALSRSHKRTTNSYTPTHAATSSPTFTRRNSNTQTAAGGGGGAVHNSTLGKRTGNSRDTDRREGAGPQMRSSSPWDSSRGSRDGGGGASPAYLPTHPTHERRVRAQGRAPPSRPPRDTDADPSFPAPAPSSPTTTTTHPQAAAFAGAAGGGEWGEWGEEEGDFGIAPPARDEATYREGTIDRWALCREEALRTGDLQVIQACPVIIGPRQSRRFQPLPHELTKELRQLIRETGVSSPNTLAFLESLSSTYIFMPHDWRTLLQISLSNTQYNVWLNDFREICSAYANDPQAGVSAHQLTGDGNYRSIDAQTGYNREVYEVIAKHAMRAIRKLPSSDRDANLSFTKIVQGPTESYTKFLDRLQSALDRQIENEEAREILSRRLAFENANVDCQRVLQTLPKRETCSISELVRACQEVGSLTHQSDLLAVALSTQLRTQQGARPREGCFICGAPDHFQRDCPQRPLALVPRKQSKARRMPKNWRRGALSHAPVQQSHATQGNRLAICAPPAQPALCAPTPQPAICAPPPQPALGWTYPTETQSS
ncbi:endogenous retrovirus group K member 5 Gag polyprotein-like [Pseudopipra pipra]|uniref:endogenous retrovirus group K member 5 Gag polyprotein-like n=1 Tax=Pseudopipra pipra TaxID=415032 RepID=UPI00313968D7